MTCENIQSHFRLISLYSKKSDSLYTKKIHFGGTQPSGLHIHIIMASIELETVRDQPQAEPVSVLEFRIQPQLRHPGLLDDFEFGVGTWCS